MSWAPLNFCYNCKKDTYGVDYIRSSGQKIFKFYGCKQCGCPYGTFREVYNRTNILNLKKQEVQKAILTGRWRGSDDVM